MKKLSSHLFLLVLTALASCLFLTFSCQPEVEPYPNQRADSTGQLLMKVACRDGLDTMSLTFRYDAQKRWIGSSLFVAINQDTIPWIRLSIIRDAAGYITGGTTIDSSEYYNGVYYDTTSVVRDAATGRYKYSISTDASLCKDTVRHIYDGQGRIVRNESSNNCSIQRGDTSTYTFSGLNVIKIARIHLSDAEDVTTAQYDTKVSPYQFGNDAMVAGFEFFASASNVIMFTDKDGNRINGQGIISYTYNAVGKPVKALLTALPSNKQYTFTFYYQ